MNTQYVPRCRLGRTRHLKCGSARASARSGAAAVALTGISAALLGAVTVAPPTTAYFVCGALLGVSATAVGFALAGWGACSRRTAHGRI
ncbi:hypothetical protein ACFWZ2_10835 [Streptomyces sp. NPDC059002]|uniref:hypothetical protein n=1 Tax=Streptomyces sp. NPDC059002 TaxID=3346690 RepID=UPI0036BA392B